MLRMPLIIVVSLAGFEIGGNLIEDDGQDAVFCLFVSAVAVPDADEVVVEADGEGETAEVVAWGGWVC